MSCAYEDSRENPNVLNQNPPAVTEDVTYPSKARSQPSQISTLAH
jgi:hypothetical protein